MYNPEYKKKFCVQLHVFLNIIHKISVPVQVCTADTWQLIILKKKLKRYFLLLIFYKTWSMLNACLIYLFYSSLSSIIKYRSIFDYPASSEICLFLFILELDRLTDHRISIIPVFVSLIFSSSLFGIYSSSQRSLFLRSNECPTMFQGLDFPQIVLW